MKQSIVQMVAIILVSGIIGFFIGRNFPAKKEVIAATKVNLETNSTPSKKSNDLKEPIAEAPVSEKGPKTEVKEPVDTKETTPDPKPTTVSNPITETSNDNTNNSPAGSIDHSGKVLKRINMGISDKKISEVLESISANLERKKLAYVSSLSQDCSGIFHQIKDSLQVQLPALRSSAEYQYPQYNTDRSTRQIADWYYKNNNLMIVEDPMAARNSIRPGAVMFFGKSNKRYKNMTIDQLTDRKNNYTPNGFIGHVAVVTSVRTDADNNVVEYTMMHGRNPRRHASRTGSKELQSARNTELPPFGNWSQQWVAVANITTPR